MSSYNNGGPEMRVFSARYILPFVIAAFLLFTVAQIAGQFFTVQQLDKTSGKITGLKIAINGRERKSGKPNYVLAIALNNNQSFYIQDTKTFQRLDTSLHNGDNVTIYTPTLLFKIVSIGFVHDVNQVERDNAVVYSFDEQKKENWVLIGFFAVAAAMFYGLRLSWLKE